MSELTGTLTSVADASIAFDDVLQNRRRLIAVGVISSVAMGGAVASSLLHLGWLSGYVVTLSARVGLIAWAIASRDRLLARLLTWGLAVALIEIAGADRWAVESGTLAYAQHGPFILRSPAYMVVSWMVACTQFGLLGLWTHARLGPWRAALVCALIGGLNLPLYEQLARDAGWWTYQNTRMFFSTPYYVIVGEVLIGAAFPIITAEAFRGGRSRAIAGAIVLGLWLWGAGAIGFWLVS